MAEVGLWWWRQTTPLQSQWRIPMARLTDTQLVILSAASQRDDRGVELPATVKNQAARKAVDKLIRAGLLEEVHAAGSLPVWRRGWRFASPNRVSKRSTSKMRAWPRRHQRDSAS
jgi:hypothetical protein